MSSLRISRLLLLLGIACAVGTLVPEADAAPPPITWLKGEGNYTKSHRAAHSIDRIVVHVTEGTFWGSVQWLQSPRAHASSHFVISRGGKIVQLVHVSDIAWHAGNWRTNVESVGIEHEGYTYGPHGFTDAQYRSSARLAAWLARRSLMPIDRRHVIGHHEVPGPKGGRGGASGHTDPGPHWDWKRYLRLVRVYAGTEAPFKITDNGIKRGDVVAGKVQWRVRTTPAVRRLAFVVDGRVLWVDRKAPFTFGRAHGFNTLLLRNGWHLVELMAYDRRGRRTVQRYPIVVRNHAFGLTTAGARPWTRVRRIATLRSTVTGAKAARVVFRVDGRRARVDRRAPFDFSWDTRTVRDGRHVLEVVAHAVDGRVAKRRITVVVDNVATPRPKPKPTPKPVPKPAPKPAQPLLRILAQSVTEGQSVEGLVIWRVEATGKPARVEFVIDGVSRGADVAAPYTFGWDTAAEPPGAHKLTARAVGRNGKTVEASVTVTVPERPGTSGSGAP